MRFSLPAVTLLLGVATALATPKAATPRDALKKLMARQEQTCYAEDTCADCFGESSTECGVRTCYDESAGEICCDNGSES